MRRTISAMVGKGSVNHNSRQFTAENVDPSRTKNNIIYCNEKIKETPHIYTYKIWYYADQCNTI